MSLAGRIIEYLQGLRVTQGHDRGEPLQLLGWQKQFIRGAFADGTTEAALGVGRANGKSTLLGGILAGCVDPDGPLHEARSENLVIAGTLRQSSIALNHARAFLAAKVGELRRRDWADSNSTNHNRIQWRKTGASIEALASTPRNAQGLGAFRLALLDEGADWTPSTSQQMFDAISTGLGKMEGSRVAAIGTQPASRDHWFSRLLREKAAGRFAMLFEVPADTPENKLLTRRVWLKANPSARDWPVLDAAIRSDAAKARKDPRRLAAFRARRCNSGTSDSHKAHLLEASVWEACGADVPDRDGDPIWAADLGHSRSASSIIALWPRTGRCEGLEMLPAVPGLDERERWDGTPPMLYRNAETDGSLILGGRRSPDLRALVATARERFGEPVAVVADRWRMDLLQDALEDAGITAEPILRGAGWFHSGPDCDSLRYLAGEGRIHPVRTPLFDWSLSRCLVTTDPTGASKLVKQTGDDLGQALVLAAGVMRRDGERLADPPAVFSIAV